MSVASIKKLKDTKSKIGEKSQSASSVIAKQYDKTGLENSNKETKVPTNNVTETDTKTSSDSSAENKQAQVASQYGTGSASNQIDISEAAASDLLSGGVGCTTYNFGTATPDGNDVSPIISFYVKDYVQSNTSSITTKDQSTDSASVQDAVGKINVTNLKNSTTDNVNAKKLQNATTNTGSATGDSIPTLATSKIEDNKKRQSQYEEGMKLLNEKVSKGDISPSYYEQKRIELENKLGINNNTTSWNSAVSPITNADNVTTSYKQTLDSKGVDSFTSYNFSLGKNWDGIEDPLQTSTSTSINAIQTQNNIYPTTTTLAKTIDVDKQLQYYNTKNDIEKSYSTGNLSKSVYDMSMDSLYDKYYGADGEIYKKDSVCSNFIKNTNSVLSGTYWQQDNVNSIATTNKQTKNASTISDDYSISGSTESDTNKKNLFTAIGDGYSLSNLADGSKMGLSTVGQSLSELGSTLTNSSSVAAKKSFVEGNQVVLDSISGINNASKILTNIANSSNVASINGSLNILSQGMSGTGIVRTLNNISNTMNMVDVGIRGIGVSKDAFSNIVNTTTNMYDSITNMKVINGSVSQNMGNIGNIVGTSVNAIERDVCSMVNAVGNIRYALGMNNNRISSIGGKAVNFANQAARIGNVVGSVYNLTTSVVGMFEDDSDTTKMMGGVVSSAGSILGAVSPKTAASVSSAVSSIGTIANSAGSIVSGVSGMFGGTTGKSGGVLGGVLGGSSSGSGQNETKDGKTQTASKAAYKSNMDKLTSTMNPQQKVSMAFCLPLPDRIEDSYGATWQLVSAESMAGKAIHAGIDPSGKGIGSAMLAFGTEAATGLIKSAGKSFIENITKGDGFVGKIVSSTVGSDGADAAQAGLRMAKLIENPRKIAEFQSWSPRVFNISWTLYPRSKTEADAIEDFTTELKYKILPSNDGLGQFLSYPSDMEFSISLNGEKLTKYPSSKSVVLTRINTTYSKEVLEDGAPVSIALSMECMETVLLTKQTFEEFTGKTVSSAAKANKNTSLSEGFIKSKEQSTTNPETKKIEDTASPNSGQATKQETKTNDGQTSSTKPTSNEQKGT